MWRLALAPVLVVALAAVTSCGGTTAGQAVPGDSTNSTEGGPSSGPTTSAGKTTSTKPNGGDGSLADTDPCSLLTLAGRTQLGVGTGQKRTVGGEPSCRWQRRGPSETYFFDVAVLDALGITDVPAQAQQIPNIGEHKAAQGSDLGGPGTCTVVLGVTESSRVDSSVGAGTDTQKACDLAKELATLVERELP